ncbi:hypothetical protein [uncultured Duncaniella sp.]|nr:hypothetical protein [uncultured Duncaniella sp.]
MPEYRHNRCGVVKEIYLPSCLNGGFCFKVLVYLVIWIIFFTYVEV